MTDTRKTEEAPAEAGAVDRPALIAYLPDGTVRLINFDEQWQHIEDLYQFLCNGVEPGQDEWLLRLVEQWQAIEAIHTAQGKRMKRGAQLRGAGPLEAPMFRFFQMVSAGFYPPPELLLGLNGCFEAYLAGGGKPTLEEVYFGPARRGAGNFARRYASTLHNEGVPMAIGHMMSTGWGREEAAEWLAHNIYGERLDADSLLRMSRGVSPKPIPPPPELYGESFWEPDN